MFQCTEKVKKNLVDSFLSHLTIMCTVDRVFLMASSLHTSEKSGEPTAYSGSNLMQQKS